MDSRANTISTIIEPLLNSDNAMYVAKMLNKNKQLSNNISMLHLDTAQDAETYLKALYRVSRRYEPKSHNLSFLTNGTTTVDQTQSSQLTFSKT